VRLSAVKRRSIVGAGLAALVGLTALVWAFGESEFSITLEEAAKPAFRKLCGAIGVGIGSGERVRRFEIRQGVVSAVAALPPAPRESRAGGGAFFGPREIVPEASEYRYVTKGASLKSPNQAYLAASVAMKDSGAHGFIIADLRTKAILSRIIYAEQVELTRAFAWSPNSEYLAVLKATLTSYWRRPQHWVSFLMGHPAQYYRFRLDVHTAASQLVAGSSLSPLDVRGPEAELVWLDGCPPSG
jgi:hypothetical protein